MNKKIISSTNAMTTRKLRKQFLMEKNSPILMTTIITVLAVTLLLSGTHSVYAMKSLGEDPSIGRVGPDQFGLATKGIVCGDHLCKDGTVKMISPVIAEKTNQKASSHAPSIMTEQVYQYSKNSPNAYLAVFKVTGGEKDLGRVKISVQSDMEQTSVPIDGLFAKGNQVVEVRIHAMDPQSIMAFPVSWQYSN